MKNELILTFFSFLVIYLYIFSLNQIIVIEKESIHKILLNNDPTKHVPELCKFPQNFAFLKPSAFIELNNLFEFNMQKIICCEHLDIVNYSDPIGLKLFIEKCSIDDIQESICNISVKRSRDFRYTPSFTQSDSKKLKIYTNKVFNELGDDTTKFVDFICPFINIIF
jgi:hypothetical protein